MNGNRPETFAITGLLIYTSNGLATGDFKMLTNAKLAFQNLRLILKSLWRLSSDNDKGLEIRCAPRVHQEKLSTITQQIPIEGAVLDLAAGSVAWLARL
jgi:hypothetical protein